MKQVSVLGYLRPILAETAILQIDSCMESGCTRRCGVFFRWVAMGYKKYVNDYEKIYVIKPNGKPGLTAVYRGKYFRFVSDGEALRSARRAVGGLSVLAAVCTVIPFLFTSVGAHTLYVSLPHVIAVFPLVHLLLGAYRVCFGRIPMIREARDKTEGRTVTSSVVAACLLGVAAVAQAVNCILTKFPLPDVIYFVFLALACASTAVVFFSRHKLKTEECTEDGEKI